MSNPRRCLSIKLATFLLSLSLTTTTHSLPLSPQKATAADLLSLLGTRQQASSISSRLALNLKSCLKFLVPFSTISSNPNPNPNRRFLREDESVDELVWWPPEPVMELARLAFDSGADTDSVHRALDPSVLYVPDIEGSCEDNCELTRTPYGRRFINEELNLYLEFLFKLIVTRGPSVGFNVSLSRYDLFHGHLFLATDTGRLGILFHAKEYPAFNKRVFPYNMGYCQRGTDVTFDNSMNLRNILWLAPLPSSSNKTWATPGVLVVLDASPGGIIYTDLIPNYVKVARTIYEEDFGDVAVDVNYLNTGGAVPDYQIFIC